MRYSRFSTLLPILVAVLLARSTCASAQSYGPGDQVLTIGAAEFRSQLTQDTYIDADGYLYYNGFDLYLAPLSLPEGALIENLCLYANDSEPGAYVEVALGALKLVPGGEGPAFQAVTSSVASSSNIGYGYYCTDPFSYSLRGRFDIDNDGAPDAVAYYVFAGVPNATQNALGLGGVQITWKRQVSDAPSTPTFGDVPTSDPAFQHIEALVASGITAGCAGGNYCPDAPLTRRQMAVFLAKALGLNWSF
jgi:S-layer homology domain